MTRAQISAFIECSVSGKRRTQRHKVYHAIAELGADTLDKIQPIYAPMKMASVAGRLSELLDLGLIKERRNNPGHFETCLTWPEVQQQKDKRDRERYEKWKHLGEKEGYFSYMYADLNPSAVAQNMVKASLS